MKRKKERKGGGRRREMLLGCLCCAMWRVFLNKLYRTSVNASLQIHVALFCAVHSSKQLFL